MITPYTRFLFINKEAKAHRIMSIKNIKASFILEDKIDTPSKNCIFKQDNVVYTIYPHARNLVNVTGIKRFEQLEIAKKIVESKLKQKVVKVRIDNAFSQRRIMKMWIWSKCINS